jgi:hypothetical protein
MVETTSLVTDKAIAFVTCAMARPPWLHSHTIVQPFVFPHVGNGNRYLELALRPTRCRLLLNKVSPSNYGNIHVSYPFVPI